MLISSVKTSSADSTPIARSRRPSNWARISPSRRTSIAKVLCPSVAPTTHPTGTSVPTVISPSLISSAMCGQLRTARPTFPDRVFVYARFVIKVTDLWRHVGSNSSIRLIRMIRNTAHTRSADSFQDRFRSTWPYRAGCKSRQHFLHRHRSLQKENSFCRYDPQRSFGCMIIDFDAPSSAKRNSASHRPSA